MRREENYIVCTVVKSLQIKADKSENTWNFVLVNVKNGTVVEDDKDSEEVLAIF